jgi:hypothetical protein
MPFEFGWRVRRVLIRQLRSAFKSEEVHKRSIHGSLGLRVGWHWDAQLGVESEAIEVNDGREGGAVLMRGHERAADTTRKRARTPQRRSKARNHP